MAARRRIASRRLWPENLYVNNQDYYYFRHPLTKEIFGLGSDLKKAIRQVKVVNAELALRSGDGDLLARIDGQKKTFVGFCDEYEVEEKNKYTNKHTITALTVQMGTLRAAACAAKLINQVTPRDIVEIIEKAQERGQTTAKDTRARLLHVFRTAINKGLVDADKNPVPSTFKPKVLVQRDRLSLKQFDAIRKKALEVDSSAWIVNALDLALITGQRREDLAALQFSDVKEGFLWVDQRKTGVKIKIPVTLRLDAADMTLDEVIQRCRRRSGVVSKFLIHSHRRVAKIKPGDPIALATLSNTFAQFRTAAELTWPEDKTPPTFHEIRSLAARLYAEQNGHDFAKVLLGHKTEEMAARYRDSRGTEWSEVKVGVA